MKTYEFIKTIHIPVCHYLHFHLHIEQGCHLKRNIYGNIVIIYRYSLFNADYVFMAFKTTIRAPYEIITICNNINWELNYEATHITESVMISLDLNGTKFIHIWHTLQEIFFILSHHPLRISSLCDLALHIKEAYIICKTRFNVLKHMFVASKLYIYTSNLIHDFRW